MPKVVLVVAMGRNRVIGRDGALPWRLSSDMKFFRETTWGKPMIAGRKTYESIGRPLPGREMIVVTRNRAFAAPGVHVVHTPDEALAVATERARAMGADEIMVIGGAQIYEALLPRADRIVLTEVDLAPEGDERFPALDPAAWREISSHAPPRGPKDDADIRFRFLERRR